MVDIGQYRAAIGLFRQPVKRGKVEKQCSERDGMVIIIGFVVVRIFLHRNVSKSNINFIWICM